MEQEIRPIRETEYDDYFNMIAQAFRAPAARARQNRQWTRMEELRGLFEQGQLKAGLKVMDHPIWMGPTAIRNGAITSVASPPENRRRGYTGRLLHAVLAELREQGVPVATLYPFSFPFYKRFGWEQVEDKYLYRVPIDRFPHSTVSGTWRPISRATDFDTQGSVPPRPVSDDDLSLLMGIYDGWCQGRTGPLVRDARRWRGGMLQQGAEQQPDIYAWYDDAGNPRAYVIYAFEELENRWIRRLIVWDHAYLDSQGLRAILDFLRNHDSQAKEVGMHMPAGFPFLAMFDNPEFKAEVEAGFMLRLVDIPAALSARAYPRGLTSRITITVHDSFCEWNNGTFALELRDGVGTAFKANETRATEQRAAQGGVSSTHAPGISLDQRALAQLYTGYLTAAQAASIGLLTATDAGAIEAAGQIFEAPPPFMPDHF